MKILNRQKIDPICLMAGDTLVVTHRETTEKNSMFWGRYQKAGRELCKTTLTAEQTMVVDEAMLFETKFEDRRALGGMVLEKTPLA